MKRWESAALVGIVALFGSLVGVHMPSGTVAVTDTRVAKVAAEVSKQLGFKVVVVRDTASLGEIKASVRDGIGWLDGMLVGAVPGSRQRMTVGTGETAKAIAFPGFCLVVLGEPGGVGAKAFATAEDHRLFVLLHELGHCPLGRDRREDVADAFAYLAAPHFGIGVDLDHWKGYRELYAGDQPLDPHWTVPSLNRVEGRSVGTLAQAWAAAVDAAGPVADKWVR